MHCIAPIYPRSIFHKSYEEPLHTVAHRVGLAGCGFGWTLGGGLVFAGIAGVHAAVTVCTIIYVGLGTVKDLLRRAFALRREVSYSTFAIKWDPI